MCAAKQNRRIQTVRAEHAETYAVLDVGSTAIRLGIADVTAAGEISKGETLSQSVSLGKDTFTLGEISNETMEASVRAIRAFRNKLDEYQVEPAHVRCVATNAVREASNRLAFLDRVYIATGLELEVIDEAEVTRLTYLAVNKYLSSDPRYADANTLATEVAGGSTEVLQLQNEYVTFSHTYRLGVLRLRQMLERQRLSAPQRRSMIESHVLRTIHEMREHVDFGGNAVLLALGGEARKYAAMVDDSWDRSELLSIPVKQWERFAEEAVEMSDDEVVRRYHLSYDDAASFGLALQIQVMIARAFKQKRILGGEISMRDGVMLDIAAHGTWGAKFEEQIVNSAIELGRRYQFDEDHAQQVTGLALHLYRALQEEHRLDGRYELYLQIAGLLHEIGGFVSDRSHHKHSMYLILHSEIFGLGERERTLIALIARYHRRSTPKPDHEVYSTLTREQRTVVSKLSAILRVADALDRGHVQRMRDIKCKVRENEFIISVPSVDDLGLEQLAMREKSGMFEDVFGLRVLLKRSRKV